MPREMSGSLARNDKKDPSSNQPDFRGVCLVGGAELKISGWLRENENGKYLSLSFTPKDVPKTETRPAASPELKSKYAPTTGNRLDHRRGVDDREIPF
jgi:hypothetical protein